MLNDMSRSRVIKIWFAAVSLVAVAAVAFGVTVGLGTGVILVALCLVPPAIVWLLWPGARATTAADVLHGVDRRS